MKLYRTLSLIGIALGAAGFAATQGCSSDSGGGTTTTTKGKQPAAPPAGAAAADTSSSRTFAVNKLMLGETDRNDVASKDAWKDFGFDLDGLQTTKDSKDVCT